VGFPQLGPEPTAVSQGLSMARGNEPLSAQVLKVPHHASRHGINQTAAADLAAREERLRRERAQQEASERQAQAEAVAKALRRP
jgi:hypothetical protein